MADLPRVRDLFEVTYGVRTGLNDAFLITKDSWLNLPDNERGFFRNAIVNKSIRDGFLSDIIFCFYPYGKYRILSEDDLLKKVPTFFKRLQRYQSRLAKRPDVAPEKWWELNRPREDWQIRVEPKIVSTYFGRAGSFAWDVTGTFLVVQGWAWLPRSKPLTSKVGLAYIALLNSPMFSELLSAVSNNVGGGQWDLSARFVNKVAIPDLNSSGFDPHLLSRLTDAGTCICRGDIVPDAILNDLMKLQ